MSGIALAGLLFCAFAMGFMVCSLLHAWWDRETSRLARKLRTTLDKASAEMPNYDLSAWQAGADLIEKGRKEKGAP